MRKTDRRLREGADAQSVLGWSSKGQRSVVHFFGDGNVATWYVEPGFDNTRRYLLAFNRYRVELGVAMSIITIVVITCVLCTNFPGCGPVQNPDPPKDKPKINLNDWNPFASSDDPEVKKENQIRQEKIEILYRYRKNMFACDLLSEPASKGKTTDGVLKSFEAKLKEAFDDIYRAYSAEPLSLDDYVDLKTENVTYPWKRIKQVAPNVNVNVLFIDDLPTLEPNWNVLEGVDPIWFHKAIAALERLNKVKHDLDSKIGEALIEAPLQIPENYELATKASPRFFVYSNKCSDPELAEQLRQFWIKTLLTIEKTEEIENASFYQLYQMAKDQDYSRQYFKKHADYYRELRILFPIAQSYSRRSVAPKGKPTP